MIEACQLLAAAIGGAGLGAFFFGGLWWTVKKGVSSQQPALLFLGSLLLRTAIVLTGFYFIARDDWRGLVAGLAGFVMTRFVITRVIGSSVQTPSPLAERGAH